MTRSRGFPAAPAALVVLAMLTLAACGGGADPDGAPSDDSSATVRVVSQNILHGVACAEDSDSCDLPGRVGLFARQLGTAGCPEIVGLQEANLDVISILDQVLPEVCDGRYEVVTDGDEGLDREIVLTTGKVIDSQRRRLVGPLRTVYFVRVVTDVGLVDFVSTHLASGSDDGPCDAERCPPPCVADDTLNSCQARQVVAFADELAHPDAVVVVAGDLNATNGETTNEVLRDAGFVDTHLEAGNAECDPATGSECTSGRTDDDLSDLTDATSKQSERIDFIYRGGTRICTIGEPTGLFNADPAPATPEGLVFPSDHTAVEATIACETSEDHRATAPTLPPVSTTMPSDNASVDDETSAEVTEAFGLVFSGDETDFETKLAAIEDSESLRETFAASFAANESVASRIAVRIDLLVPVDATRVAVTYSLLLDGAAVLDHLEGEAVKIDDRWLVSKRTYCEVSTTGASEFPEPCRLPPD